jgi:hypothetical protein
MKLSKMACRRCGQSVTHGPIRKHENMKNQKVGVPPRHSRAAASVNFWGREQ